MTQGLGQFAELLELLTIPGGLACFTPTLPEHLSFCWHVYADAANDDHRNTAA